MKLIFTFMASALLMGLTLEAGVFGFHTSEDLAKTKHIYAPTWANEEVVLILWLEDYSKWRINPKDVQVLAETNNHNHYETTFVGGKSIDGLIRQGFTIMPGAGTEEYPFLIVSQNGISFTAAFYQHPHSAWKMGANSLLNLLEVDSISGSSLKFGWTMDGYPRSPVDRRPVPDRRFEHTVWINPAQASIAKTWEKGQTLLYGGAWMPAIQHPDYDERYPFILYNYTAKQFLFFGL